DSWGPPTNTGLRSANADQAGCVSRRNLSGRSHPKMKSQAMNRRKFLRQFNCAAIGSSAILNTLLNLRLANSVAGQTGPLDNKALVCIFLSGGIESFNLLVPWEKRRYTAYSNYLLALATIG